MEVNQSAPWYPRHSPNFRALTDPLRKLSKGIRTGHLNVPTPPFANRKDITAWTGEAWDLAVLSRTGHSNWGPRTESEWKALAQKEIGNFKDCSLSMGA